MSVGPIFITEHWPHGRDCTFEDVMNQIYRAPQVAAPVNPLYVAFTEAIMARYPLADHENQELDEDDLEKAYEAPWHQNLVDDARRCRTQFFDMQPPNDYWNAN